MEVAPLMVNRESNPLLPLQSIELSAADKRHIWENVVQKTQGKAGAEPLNNRNPSRKPIVTSSVLAAAAVLALVGYTNPDLLHVGKVFNLLRSRMFSTLQVSKAISLGYGQQVNQSVTSQGITLTIGNVYADPTKFVFDMVESFHDREFRKPVIQDKDISLNINGTRKLTGFSGGEFKAVSGGKYAGIIYLPVMNDQPYKPLPSTFTLNVHVHQIGSVKGNWSFSIPVTEQKMQADTKEFHPNVKVSDNGYSMEITDVSISPVQTIVQSTMAIPSNGSIPDQMFLIDNHGRVIGGRIESKEVIRKTQNERVIQMTIVGAPPSKGATELTITPLRFFTSAITPLHGPYPSTATVLPGLQASITGVDFNADNTIVYLSMNQSKYKHLTTYKGHSNEAQFFLVTHSGISSNFIGSTSFEFDSATSNSAKIVFAKVNPNEQWGLEKSYTQPQSGLVAKVSVK